MLADAEAALARPPSSGTPLGIYAHIPFCRKRCHFCYFRVYTDKDSTAIRGYLDAAIRELELYAARPFIGGRKPQFVYFGGGTPSYLSPEQRVPSDHPLRAIRQMTEVALADLSARFELLYARVGRPSVPPEKLLRALLLQVLYTVRSERMLMEQLDYNLLFRWFVGLGVDELSVKGIKGFRQIVRQGNFLAVVADSARALATIFAPRS